MSNAGCNVYLLFIVSWFLHLPSRMPFLGVIRFDLVLVVILTFLALMRPRHYEGPTPQIDKVIRVLFCYVVLTIPFVEWPGSVIKSGIPELIKAVVFYYFTVWFITTERDLKKLIFTFLACNTFRVLEPLYLHLTDGYWGKIAAMSGGAEFLYRLSGAPHDVVNPNGLGFLACTVLTFSYFLAGLSWKYALAFVVTAPAALYTLALTGSRSAIVGLCVILLGILVKSKRRMVLLLCLAAVIIGSVPFLSTDMQDRYLSIVGLGSKNIETARERWDAMEGYYQVFLRKPLFGHGLGTSVEANFHFNDSGPYAGKAIRAHNLYLELLQELGLVGLVIFAVLMKTIISTFLRNQRINSVREAGPFLPKLVDAMQVWLLLLLIISFASCGLSSDEWYLFGGVTVVIQRIGMSYAKSESGEKQALRHQFGRRLRSWPARIQDS